MKSIYMIEDMYLHRILTPFTFQGQLIAAEADKKFKAKCMVTLQTAFHVWKNATVVFREKRELKELADRHRNNALKQAYLVR